MKFRDPTRAAKNEILRVHPSAIEKAKAFFGPISWEKMQIEIDPECPPQFAYLRTCDEKRKSPT